MEDVFSRYRLDGKALALRTIKNKIEDFISSKTYQDLDDFISDNPTLDVFQNHTKMNNTLRKVWGYQITDQEYLDILEELKRELAERKQIDTDNIKSVQANGKEIVTYQEGGDTMVLDNSYADKSMEEQLPDLQAQHTQFQTGGASNTEAMMNYMEEEVKPSVNFQSTSSINNGMLNESEQQNLAVAKSYEQESEEPLQVDLQNGLILQNGEIKTIEQREDGIGIYSAETASNPENEEEQKLTAKPKQKTLSAFRQAGFSNVIVLVFITGLVLGIVLFTMFIP